MREQLGGNPVSERATKDGVTNADIDEAIRRMREWNGGHKPYAPSVYSVALQVAHERMAQYAPAKDD